MLQVTLQAGLVSLQGLKGMIRGLKHICGRGELARICKRLKVMQAPQGCCYETYLNIIYTSQPSSAYPLTYHLLWKRLNTNFAPVRRSNSPCSFTISRVCGFAAHSLAIFFATLYVTYAVSISILSVLSDGLQWTVKDKYYCSLQTNRKASTSYYERSCS